MVGPKKGATDLNLYKKLRKHRNQGLKHEKIRWEYKNEDLQIKCLAKAWKYS